MEKRITELTRYFDMINEGDIYPTYTRDTWVIPEEGTEMRRVCTTLL